LATTLSQAGVRLLTTTDLCACTVTLSQHLQEASAAGCRASPPCAEGTRVRFLCADVTRTKRAPTMYTRCWIPSAAQACAINATQMWPPSGAQRVPTAAEAAAACRASPRRGGRRTNPPRTPSPRCVQTRPCSWWAAPPASCSVTGAPPSLPFCSAVPPTALPGGAVFWQHCAPQALIETILLAGCLSGMAQFDVRPCVPLSPESAGMWPPTLLQEPVACEHSRGCGHGHGPLSGSHTHQPPSRISR
jgi:hypothetical protein